MCEKCKKVRTCPYCHAVNGTVKKVAGAPPTPKMVHKKYRGRHSEEELKDLIDSLSTAMDVSKDFQQVMSTLPMERLAAEPSLWL
jgi:hypothetical protein